MQALATTNGNITAGGEKTRDQPAHIASKDQRDEPRERKAESRTGQRRHPGETTPALSLNDSHFDLRALSLPPCPAPLISFNAQCTPSRPGRSALWIRRVLAVLVVRWAGALLFHSRVPWPRDLAGDGPGANWPRTSRAVRAGAQTSSGRARSVNCRPTTKTSPSGFGTTPTTRPCRRWSTRSRFGRSSPIGK